MASDRVELDKQTVSHVTQLDRLEDKIRPDHTALVAIDVLNDFCAAGGMMERAGFDLGMIQAMTKRLGRLLERARAIGVFVVFVRNVYSTEKNLYLSDVWLEQASRRETGFAYFSGEACPPDSWQNDFYENIRPTNLEPIVTKHRYSSFYNTDLELILRSHGIRTVIATGVATEVCVETAVREAFVRDFYVVLPRDGVATYSQSSHDEALRRIDSLFGHVTSIDDILAGWRLPEGAAS